MTDSPSGGVINLDGPIGRALSHAIGRELLDARERKDWSRRKLAVQLDMKSDTLEQYELGRTWVPLLRFVGLCILLNQDPTAMLGRALRRAVEGSHEVALTVDLRALLRAASPIPLVPRPWARAKRSEGPRELVELSPDHIQALPYLALPHDKVAGYIFQPH